MAVPSIDMNKDQFIPNDEDEELLEPKVLYLSAIGALMYIAKHQA
jgi:hypothetical protein